MNAVFDRKPEADKLANIEQMANDLAHVTLPTHKVKWMINRIRELEREAVNVTTVFPQTPPNYDDEKTVGKILNEFAASRYIGRPVYAINAEDIGTFSDRLVAALAKARGDRPHEQIVSAIAESCIAAWVTLSGIALSAKLRDQLHTIIADALQRERTHVAQAQKPADDSTVNKYCVIGTSGLRRTFKPTVDQAIAHSRDLLDGGGGNNTLLVVKVESVVERGKPVTRALRPGELAS